MRLPIILRRLSRLNGEDGLLTPFSVNYARTSAPMKSADEFIANWTEIVCARQAGEVESGDGRLEPGREPRKAVDAIKPAQQLAAEKRQCLDAESVTGPGEHVIRAQCALAPERIDQMANRAATLFLRAVQCVTAQKGNAIGKAVAQPHRGLASCSASRAAPPAQGTTGSGKMKIAGVETC